MYATATQPVAPTIARQAFLADLRSDTVTQPTPAMRQAMRDAEVGDDVFGDDPTVNRLQAVLAERLGFEAGLLLPTGTMSNLAAVMTHCQRGEEMIVGQGAHTYKYEAGGAAVLGSVQPQPLAQEKNGAMPLEAIASAIKPDDAHFARTRLVALENTFGGRVLPLDYIGQVDTLRRAKQLALHLDGARVFNAMATSDRPQRDWVRAFDSVSVCLSKGLGTPAGSVLLGPREFIERAKRPRKMLGGTMRQAGVLAAAGLYALEHHVTRLRDDHARAARLASALAKIPGLAVEPPQTNMVWIDGDGALLDRLHAHLIARRVNVLRGKPMRLVTHLDVTDERLTIVLDAIDAFEG